MEIVCFVFCSMYVVLLVDAVLNGGRIVLFCASEKAQKLQTTSTCVKKIEANLRLDEKGFYKESNFLSDLIKIFQL